MAITKATPRSIENGITDNSATTIALESEAIPQHLPLFMIQAPKGELTTKFMTGTSALEQYGADAFDESKGYFSHQTAGLVTAAGQGNLVAVRRVADADASVGAFCLAVEYYAEDLPTYQRDATGAITLTVNGLPTVVTGVTVTGIQKRLVLMTGITAANYKTQSNAAGTIANAAGDNSLIVPLISGISTVGLDANNVGFRLEVPHMESADPASEHVAEDQLTNLYRWAWFKRANANSTPERINSLLLERAIDFSFQKGTISTVTSASYEKERVLTQYERDTTGYVPLSGPVEEMFFYEDNIEATLEIFYQAEVSAASSLNVTSLVTAKHQMNLWTEKDFSGIDFYGFAELTGGITVDSLTTHYLTGGSDGAVNEATLDTLTAAFLVKDWDDADEPLNDVAQYPFSVLYDTGFSASTKGNFLDCMGKRSDIKVDVCTQDMTADEYTLAEDLSAGQALRARAILSPESTLNGTASCRASVWGSVGTWTESLYGKRMPTVLDIIYKRSRYAGSSDGVLDSRYAYDDRDVNSVSVLTNITHTYRSSEIKDLYWDSGINYVQYRDRSDLFWPTYQTVYDDDTSVLNGDIAVQILIDLKKKAHYHWSINTGDAKLTKAEFIERSDADFLALIDGIYDDRFVITFGTVFTPNDTARGYSWTLNIDAAADPARTVGSYNISVSRPE